MSENGKKETSSAAAILKTIGFFAGIFIVGYFFANLFYQQIPKDPGFKDYRFASFRELGGYEYYTPLPGEAVVPEKLAANQIPENIKALDGKKVIVEGYMLPAYVDRDGQSAEFALNGNYDMCFYGAATRINDYVMVKMKEGKKAPFSHEPLKIYGTLSVGEEIRDGQLISLYRLSADAVNAGGQLIR